MELAEVWSGIFLSVGSYRPFYVRHGVPNGWKDDQNMIRSRIIASVLLGAVLSGPVAADCSSPTAAIVGRAPCSWGSGLVCLFIKIQNRLDRPISFVEGHEKRLIGELSTRYDTRRSEGGIWENQVLSITDYSASVRDFPKLTVESGGTETFVVYFPKLMVRNTKSQEIRVVLVDTEGHRYETESLSSSGEPLN
jgi:hypothetical protein